MRKHSPRFALTMARRLSRRGPVGTWGCRPSAVGGAEPGDGSEVRGGGDDKAGSDQTGAR
jgi:hypothetical protein